MEEFTEAESGKKDNRQLLQLSIILSKKGKATLVIAKLGRLSRNAAFIFTLRDSGVDFVCRYAGGKYINYWNIFRTCTT